MAKITEGDRVRVITRPALDEDLKAYSYFEFYGGLTGSVNKIYINNDVVVEVEPESLTRDIRKRHEEVRDQMKTKWLDGLSEEGRSKLTEREKDFILRYTILVKMDDLESAGVKPAPKPTTSVSSNSAPTAAGGLFSESEPGTDIARKTLAELEAAEEAELLRRQG